MEKEKTLPIFNDVDEYLGEHGTAPELGSLAEAAQAAGEEVTVAKVTCEVEPPDQGATPAPDHKDNPTRAIVSIIAPWLDPEVIQMADKVQELLKYSRDRKVATIEEAKSATNDLIIIKELKKVLEKKRVEDLIPLREYTDAINATFKLISDPLNMADNVTGDKILAFKQEQGRLRLEAENAARLQREADEAARKVLEKTGEIVSEQEEAPVIVPDIVSKQVHADLGTAGVTTNWKWEVTDFALLPDEYKVVDGSLLTTVARKHHDRKPVPGVRFYAVEGLSARQRGGQ